LEKQQDWGYNLQVYDDKMFIAYHHPYELEGYTTFLDLSILDPKFIQEKGSNQNN
jgi:hypothetical protein